MARTRRTEITHIDSGSSADLERTTPNVRRSTRLAAASKQKATSKALNKSTNKNKEEKEEDDDTTGFNCNICFDAAKEPVVTCCGHLYCWPCLFQWLQLHSGTKECPVCKGRIDESTVLPIYGRGGLSSDSNEEEKGEGSVVPPRPQGHRVESFRQIIQAWRGRELIAQGIREILFPDAEVLMERGAGIDVNNGVSPQGLDRSNVVVEHASLETNNVEASLTFRISRSTASEQNSLDTSAIDVPRPPRQRRRRE